VARAQGGRRPALPRPPAAKRSIASLKDLTAVDLDVLETIVSRSYSTLTGGTYTKRARETGSIQPAPG